MIHFQNLMLFYMFIERVKAFHANIYHADDKDSYCALNETVRPHKKCLVSRPLKIEKVMGACVFIFIFYLFYKVKLLSLRQE